MAQINAWPRVIKSTDEDSGLFKPIIDTLISLIDPPTYIVFCPKDRWGKRETEPQLLVCFNQYLEIFKLERDTKSIFKVQHRYDACLILERKKALLYSYIKIVSIQNDHSLESLIEFNSVTLRIFEPILNRFRVSESSDNNKEDQNIQAVMDRLDYRCRNILDEGRFNARNLKALLYQAEQSKPFLWFFKKTLSMPKLILVLKNEWISIDLGERLKWGVSRNEERYTYIPLHAIKQIEIDKVSPSQTHIKLILEHEMMLTVELFSGSSNVFSHPIEGLDIIVQNLK